MSNPWFRLYSEFATDPKVQMLSEAMQRRLLMIMCMRCSNTLVTLQEQEIAFQLRITDAELAETKAVFVARGFVDSAWNVLNWEKRQFASDTSKARVAKHRALQKAKQNTTTNDNVTLQKRQDNALEQNRTDTDTEQIQRERTARASRLPADVQLSSEWIDFCKAERKDLDPSLTFEKFRDYWTAKPGKAGTKLDWTATWRNWVREEKKQVVQQQRNAAKSFAEADREAGMLRWEQQTGRIHPDRQSDQSRVIDITPNQPRQEIAYAR